MNRSSTELRRAAERPAGSGTVALLDGGVHAVGKVVEAARILDGGRGTGPQRTAEEIAR